MKARVHVALKESVLDPQGQTIRAALNGLGHSSVLDLRQGKYFDVTLDDSMSPADAESKLKQIAHDVLANPVIEEYWVEVLPG